MPTISTTNIFFSINETIQEIATYNIDKERKSTLQPLIDYIQLRVSNEQKIRLNFICTHNSRRSHLSQVWAQTLATYFNISDVSCYSGGTETTAMFPMVAKTLSKTGFQIQKLSDENNPVYSIKFASNEPAIIGFSKVFSDSFNPQSEFAAIMTCSSADQNCPFVSGADARIPVTFEDPKAFDNTPQQAKKYEERSLQIASELYYIFSQIKK